MKKADNCELYAIAGRSAEKAESFKEEFGFEKSYAGYEKLLEDPEVQAVYIPLPNHLHKEWVIKALKAGKHVLCEKPLALNASDAKEMFATAKENNVILMEAYAYLHSPYIAALKEVLDSGAIGDVVYMESAFITSDYDISNIRMRRETFGGATYDLGCYNTSLILWLLGREPERVQAAADYSGTDVDMLTTAVLGFEGGAKAAFTAGMVLPTNKDERLDRLQICGTRGRILSSVEFNQEGNLSFTVETGSGTEVKTVHARQNYALEVEQLGRCIREGEKPHVSPEFSIKNAELLDALLETVGF
jgi:predicted dehydrogenase